MWGQSQNKLQRCEHKSRVQEGQIGIIFKIDGTDEVLMMELIGSDDLLTSYQIFDLIGYQDQGRIMKPSFELFQREVEKEFWTRC